MIYLLDADTVMAGLLGGIGERLNEAKGAGDEIAISVVTLFQLRHRITRGPRRFEERARLRGFLSDRVAILSFDADDAALAGELQFALEAAGTPVAAYDLLVAAQALRRGATVVTASLSGLARIPGLAWQDWITRDT